MLESQNRRFRFFESESYENLEQLMLWMEDVFCVGDYFVTINLVGISDIQSFMKKKINAIERTVFLRRPSTLYRAVMIVREPHPHIHMLIKDVPFQSERFCNLQQLIDATFRKTLKRHMDVDVQRIFATPDIVSLYATKSQKSVMFDRESSYLPESLNSARKDLCQ